MGILAHQVLLALSIAALGGFGVRLASLAAPRGLERAVAAAVIASTAAAIEALLLGLVKLGTSPVPLGLAAGASWLGSKWLLPVPAVAPSKELADWWRRTPAIQRTAVSAALGAGLAWSAWLLRYPALGIDSVAYHVPEVVGWLNQGTPGAVEPIFPNLPVGNYPLTNEVLLAWGSGIGRSFVFITLWSPAMMLLLAGASWSGLRTLHAPRPASALAIGAVCATPVLTHYQMNGANTDLPALTWLVSAGCLALASRTRPALLAPALLAASLAVGTKTTALPLAAAVVVAAAVGARVELRRLATPLLIAVAAALAVGSYWYLRNLVDHGSPLWPFLRGPWGDPLPSGVKQGVTTSFLQRPAFTIQRVGHGWLDLFGGGFLMLAGALVVGLLARARAVTWSALAAAVSLLIWLNAPLTGASVRHFEVATKSTVRYLLPGLAAAALTLALAAGGRRPAARAAATVVLVGALGVNLVQTANLGFPSVPSPWTPLAGAALGGLAALVGSRLGFRLPPLAPGARVVGLCALAIATAVGLAPAASGYVRRHAAAAHLYGTDMVRWFAARPTFRDGDRPMAGAPIVLGPLAGDRFQHRFEWIPQDDTCDAVRARTRLAWVLVFERLPSERPVSRTGRCLSRSRATFRGLGFSVYGG